MALDLLDHTTGWMHIRTATSPESSGQHVAATSCHAVPYGKDLLGIPIQALRARLRSLSPYGTQLSPWLTESGQRSIWVGQRIWTL